MDLESLVAKTIRVVGDLVSKPKMSEKHLSKPPFRFLHDVVSAITRETGFGEGLYSGGELDAKAISDKAGKIDYLSKIFNLVGICKGEALDIRATKVVAGLEPEYTNIFLCTLAECASDPAYDSAEAVNRALQGMQAGDVGPCLKGGADSKETPGGGLDAGADSKRGDDFGAKAAAPPMTLGEAKSGELGNDVVMERGKSRGGTRGGKPQHQTTDVGLGGFSGAPTMNLDHELEKCDGSTATTQAMLGEVITKPKLKDQLLSKPPFRFLFDVVMEVRNVTGFGNGLFSEAENDSKSITKKEEKIQFLEKIIKTVGVHLNTIVEARPSKIVAGLDPDLTNFFLQYLAVCAKHSPDSKSAVANVLDTLGVEGGVTVVPTNDAGGGGSGAAAMRSMDRAEAKNDNEMPSLNAKGAEGDRDSDAKPMRVPPAERKTIQPDSSAGGEEDGAKRGVPGRPTTARRRPPKVKDGAKEVDKAASPVKKAEGIITDGADDDDDDDDIPIDIDNRLADDIGADAKNADGSAPQSKIVRDILGRQADYEATRNNDTEAIASDAKEPSQDSQGKSGIRIGRLRKTGSDRKSSGDAPSFGEGDIERLRGAIQSLVQHTGPLGGCLDFLQEDVSLMSAELRRWEDECRKFEAKLAMEKEKSVEALHPLKTELLELDEQITEKKLLISSSKANITRNEDKLQQLLKLMSSA